MWNIFAYIDPRVNNPMSVLIGKYVSLMECLEDINLILLLNYTYRTQT